jgi:hypothetical protein
MNQQPLKIAALASAMVAPILATPADALALGALLCSAALASAIISAIGSGDPQWAKSRAYAHISRGSYIRR